MPSSPFQKCPLSVHLPLHEKLEWHPLIMANLVHCSRILCPMKWKIWSRSRTDRERNRNVRVCHENPRVSRCGSISKNDNSARLRTCTTPILTTKSKRENCRQYRHISISSNRVISARTRSVLVYRSGVLRERAPKWTTWPLGNDIK